jgi:hypothetical protein
VIAEKMQKMGLCHADAFRLFNSPALEVREFLS